LTPDETTSACVRAARRDRPRRVRVVGQAAGTPPSPPVAMNLMPTVLHRRAAADGSSRRRLPGRPPPEVARAELSRRTRRIVRAPRRRPEITAPSRTPIGRRHGAGRAHRLPRMRADVDAVARRGSRARSASSRGRRRRARRAERAGTSSLTRITASHQVVRSSGAAASRPSSRRPPGYPAASGVARARCVDHVDLRPTRTSLPSTCRPRAAELQHPTRIDVADGVRSASVANTTSVRARHACLNASSMSAQVETSTVTCAPCSRRRTARPRATPRRSASRRSE